MSLNIAVDIGGTFTDLIGFDEDTGRLFSSKSPTTPKELNMAILECLKKSGTDASQVDNFVHGSTTAINTVIERKGAVTALIVTRGTRDVYRIGRGNRPEAYDLYFKRPVPLVPRHMTSEIEERLLASGEVLIPLNASQVMAVIKKIKDLKAEAIAVSLLHSWANPAHEIKVGEMLAAEIPEAYVSLSHEILREYGEYERTSTTVINSYIGPKISKYVDDLEKSLASRQFKGRLLIMQSNGGVMPPITAKRVPVNMLESGPVGGFIAASRIGSRLGYGNVIALDMGGTTAKTNLIKDGEPQISHGYYIGGYASGQPVMLPLLDVVEIGAGGGSIAWIDEIGALKVGPQSAGSDPGPICYGWGGTEPTITDVNLICGRLSPDAFLGGEMPLDMDKAKAGLVEKISSKLGVSPIQAALAIIKIAVVNMSLAVRGISIERGYDPRDFVMVSFGGAGPLHAVEVARELHIPVVVVPNYPANFSALGMLMADVKHDYVRTYYKSLADTNFEEVSAMFDELVQTGSRTLEIEDVNRQDMVFQRFLDIRYSGQEFSIPVPTPIEYLKQADTAAIRKSFNEIHDRRYGYHADDLAVEIVNIRLIAVGKRKQISPQALKTTGNKSPLIENRMVYLEGEKPVNCAIYQRENMPPGFKITGPAIIQEYACTTVLFPGDRATIANTGEIIINVQEGNDVRG